MYEELDQTDKTNQARFNQYMEKNMFNELLEEMKSLDYLYEYKINFLGNTQSPNTIGMAQKTMNMPLNPTNNVIKLPMTAQYGGGISLNVNQVTNVIDTKIQGPGIYSILAGPKAALKPNVPIIPGSGGNFLHNQGGMQHGIKAPPMGGIFNGNNLQTGNQIKLNNPIYMPK